MHTLGARYPGSGGSTWGQPSRMTSSAPHRPRAALLFAPVLLLCGQPLAWGTDLPTGGTVVSGAGTVNTQGRVMTITQGSARLSMDWQGFSIGPGYTVNAVQPSSSAVGLHRVLGSDVSLIQGSLNANGHFFLINPNGVLFTPTAQVNVGSLLVSTLNLTDADVAAGRYRFGGSSSNAIINHGRISTRQPGGTIALVAARIVNTGSLSAQQGQVLLGAGRQVTLDLGGPVKIHVDQGALDALITQGGAIRADGGLVYLTAASAGDLAATVIRHTGTTEAHTLATGEKGQIYLRGGMASDRIVVGGVLDASAPQGGDGGFIDTSAAKVSLASDLRVTTAAPGGRTGTWLIDPSDYFIAPAGGDVTGAQLSSQLATTNVLIESSAGQNGQGQGDIHVNDAVSWSANTLTLTAARHVLINAVMTVGGSATLAMKTGTANGNDGGVGEGSVKVGMAAGEATGFAGRVDFGSRSGTGLLSINGNDYTVINALGAEGSTTGTDLQGMQGDVAGHYALGADIDASATSSWAAGEGFSPVGGAGPVFTGRFDGLGHRITGLSINRPGADNQGLIGRSFDAQVRNVGLVGAQVAGNNQVGALMGEAVVGAVLNSFATGGQITGSQRVGGLVGGNNTVRVDDSHSSNTVSGVHEVGGLLGWTNGGMGSARNYATGSVTGTGNYVGGLVGHNDFAFTLSDSHASGAVSGVDYVGGLVGSNYNGTIHHSHASGTVTATGNRVGGLAGHSAGTVEASHATGTVVGATNVGGLVGTNEGWLYNSYATGNVTGLVQLVGGLTGQSNGHILNSYATGAVTGPSYVGGLSGYSNSFIANSYATGSVTATGDEVGGLVGHQGGDLIDSYATGAVSSPGASVGGLNGFNDGNVINSYWDTTSSGQATSAGGIGMSTAAMKTQANFTSATTANGESNATWNFAGDWVMYEGHTTPLLRVFMTPLTISAASDSKTYDGLSYSGSNGVAYSIDTPDPAKLLGTLAVGGSAQGATQAGQYQITASGLYSHQQGYVINYAAGALTIDPRAITVTAGTQDKVYGESDPTLGYQLTAGSLVDNDTLAGSLARAPGEDVGGYTIDASGLSNSNYLITAQDGVLAITPRPITVSGHTQAKTYGDMDPTLGYQITSGSLLGNDELTGALTRAAGENVGMYAIDVSALANGNYLITAQGGSLSIDPRPITVSADDLAKIYGELDPTLSYQLTAGSLVGNDTLAGSLARAAGEDTGGYTIDASGLSNSNYLITAQDGLLTITPRPITVSADDLVKAYGQADPALSYRLTSGSLVDGDTLAGSLTRTPGEAVGRYTIDGSALANGNYLITVQSGSLTIGALGTAQQAAITGTQRLSWNGPGAVMPQPTPVGDGRRVRVISDGISLPASATEANP